MKYIIIENKKIKKLESKHYNYLFDKQTGFFARWGKTKEENPLYSPFGPEIADIEISTVCKGIGTPCKFCYKGNTSKGENMNISTFKKVFNNLPKTITQIAFGIGDIDGNKDFFKIMKYSRKNGVIPNVTINGYNLKDKYAKKLSQLCGAVAVSRYTPKDFCYDAVKKLTDLGMKQVNIHMMVSEETYDACMETINDFKTDSRLKNLNAIVLLSLKQKGRGTNFNPLAFDKFKSMVNYCLDNEVRIGFDSCFTQKFLDTVKHRDKYNEYEACAEPCESFGIFSSYINVKGSYFPCSFCEKATEDWNEGIDLTKIKDFGKEVWNSEKVLKWRIKSLQMKRACPIYNI